MAKADRELERRQAENRPVYSACETLYRFLRTHNPHVAIKEARSKELEKVRYEKRKAEKRKATESSKPPPRDTKSRKSNADYYGTHLNLFCSFYVL
jgi:hypothetical protein